MELCGYLKIHHSHVLLQWNLILTNNMHHFLHLASKVVKRLNAFRIRQKMLKELVERQLSEKK